MPQFLNTFKYLGVCVMTNKPAAQWAFSVVQWATARLALLSLLLALSGAGPASAADWAKSFSGISAANTYTMATTVDASGNVYIAGYLDDATLTLGSATLTRIGSQDAFVAKLDASGTVLWAKNYGGSGANARNSAIAVDADGNVLLAGYFQNASLTIPVLTKLGSQDTFALKLDTNGTTVWARNYGGSGADTTGSAIAVDAAGNVFLAGYFQNASLTTPALSTSGNQDAFALKLDAASGATSWAQKFGGDAITQANAIAVDSVGNVLLGGNFGYGNLTTPALNVIGTYDAFAFKLDAGTGAVTWAKNFGGSGAVAITYAIAGDSSGNVLLGGYFQNASLTTPALSRIGGGDAFAFKLDASGTPVWTKNFGGSGAYAQASGIAVDSAGNVLLGGVFSNGNLTTPAFSRIGNHDAFAFKLDATNGTTTWAKNYGGSYASTNINAIAVDGSGNVYLGGAFDKTLTTPTLSPIGSNDAFAFKLDANGATTWSKHYGGGYPGGTVQVQASAVDAAGNTYIAGNFQAASAQLGSVTLTQIGNQDAFAAKFDTSGTVLWAKNFGGSGGANVQASGIAVDGSGNVYLGGYFEGSMTTPALPQIGDSDAFAIKLNASGTTTWAKNFGGSGANVSGSTIAVDGSGNVYLGGSFQNANLTTPALTPIGNNDAFAFKLNASGTTMWAKNFGGNGAYAYGKSIAVDGSGNVVLAGYFSDANLTTPLLTQIGSFDGFAVKLNASGATTWAKSYGGNGAQVQIYATAMDGSGNIYLGGNFYSTLTTPPLTPIGGQDAFAFKLDTSGTTTWAKNFGGSNAAAYVTAIAVDSSGNVFLGGSFDSSSLTTPALTKAGAQDAFVFRLDTSGTITWNSSYGGSGANAGVQGIAVDSSGNVLLGGYFSSANLTTPALTKVGDTDALLIRVSTASVADAPTSIIATPSNASVSLAFTAPANNGGAAIDTYTATATPDGQTGTCNGPAACTITVSGLSNGTAYTFTVTAHNSIGNSSASTASTSVTPSAPVPSPEPDPAPTTITLPSGDSSSSPNAGQSVVVNDNSSNGTTINLPVLSNNNSVNITLPGTGTVNVGSTSNGTQLGVQQVIRPGTTTAVSTVTVNSGVASFTANQVGQAMAGLKNGIVVVSGSNNSKLTVDASGSAANLGVNGSDTIIVPTNSPTVAGTTVSLPAPAASSNPVTVQVGSQSLSVQASSNNSSLTIKVLDVDGTPTPVLAVTGSAQVSSQGGNQPLLSLGGRVLRSGSSKVCNTTVQATSSSSDDVVHVLTCNIVLPTGALSTKNGFTALTDGIIWAGETADFDKDGKLTAAYLGSHAGNTTALGDNSGNGNSTANGSPLTVNAFIPRLAGTALRLNGARVDDSIFAVLLKDFAGSVATPAQNSAGVYVFRLPDATSGSLVTVATQPIKRVKVDTSRPDGVTVGEEGIIEVSSGGYVIGFIPSLSDPEQFAKQMALAAPGASSELRGNGSWQITAADGKVYIARPVWLQTASNNASDGFSSNATGSISFNYQGMAQTLVADFADYASLQTTFQSALNDPGLTVRPLFDGSAAVVVKGQSLKIYPQWNLIPAANQPAWWSSNGEVFIKYSNGSAQGFTVK